MTHQNPDILAQQAEVEWEKISGRADALTAAERTRIPAQPMREHDPLQRRYSVEEVAMGYTTAQARVEANRCLHCANAPCIKDCPVKISIPAFIHEVANARDEAAASVLAESTLLPAVCGRVCPQETQCQKNCTLGKILKDPEKGVSIGRLERFVADTMREQHKVKPPDCAPETGKKLGIIGSGPAGLVAAADCRRAGHSVTIFEAFHTTGGVMTYGIPEFRLPKAIVRDEIQNLMAMGVQIETNFVVGRTRKLLDLMHKDGFDALFIGSGAGLPLFMNIEGENLVGVFAANEYLTRANLMKAFDTERAVTPISRAKRVAVLGGGNVAMDAARTALRLGAEEVSIIYRRTLNEMPARHEEVLHAQEEGVRFELLTNAKRCIGDEQGAVCAVECVRYELGEPGADGRRKPVQIPNSEFTLPIDAVIVAIGNGSNPLIARTTPELAVDDHGRILTDEHGETSIKGVFAGGDIVLGAATVILAMGEGRRAAASINAYLASPEPPAAQV